HVPHRPRGVPRGRAHPLRRHPGRAVRRQEGDLEDVVDARREVRGRQPPRVRGGRAPPQVLRQGKRAAHRPGAASLSDGAAVRRRRRSWLGPAMLLPAILYIVALVGVPFILAFLYAVGDVKVGSVGYHFVGLSNFTSAFESPTFRRALLNSFVFTISSQ